MTPTALKALNGSIQKWTRIVAGTGCDEGKDNCPLCQIYFKRACKGCPVMKHTGEIQCGSTPYDDEWGGGDILSGRADTDERILAAAKELRFLRSLLP